MIKETTINKYKTYIGKTIGSIKIEDIDLSKPNRNIPFNLTLEQINDLCSKPCFYCNKERCLGIDRLNNSKEYSIDNCVPCCGSCNRMKMDLTLPFFLEQIKKIYLNHKESSTTISKESTSKAIVDGSGEHLYYKDGDIVYPT